MSDLEESSESNQEQLRENWIESLLWSATHPEDHSDRVAKAMRLIDEVESSAGDASTDDVHPRQRTAVGRESAFRHPRGLSSYRWLSLAAAVVLLLSLFLLLPNGGARTAMAAIQRSLDVAAERLTRKYQVRISYRPAIEKSLLVECDLYVQGDDRFVLRHPGIVPNTNRWLGTDGHQSWVVPAFGPVMKGDSTVFRQFRSLDEMDAPSLHIRRMLIRMSQGYHLQSLRDEEIATFDGLIVCQHIRANLKSDKRLARGERPTALRKLPDAIELWASRESGMAMRLVAQWDLRNDEVGRKSIELVYQGEQPSLTDAWFTAEGHYNGLRQTIDSSSSNSN